MARKASKGGTGKSLLPPSLFSAQGPFAQYIRAVQPKDIVGENLKLWRSLFDIATGRSSIAPDARDWRFKDAAWTTNPLYKRLGQSYLAMTEAIEAMIPDDLPAESRQRAELAASIVTTAFAPTNTLAGNPAALRRTLETKGGNLAKGFRNFVDDWVNNAGMPSQVDSSSFELGRNAAATPGKVVHRADMFELIQYKPVRKTVYETPVLLVPPQIGRYYFTDLAPGRSFAEFVLKGGLQHFVISWRNPQPQQREWGLDDYARSVVEAAGVVEEITGQAKVNLIGFCAGGITSSIVASHLAAKGSEVINTLTICVTMLDFDCNASIGAFRLPAMLAVAKAQSNAKGILAGQDLGKVFNWMRPNDLVWTYWVNNYLMGETPPAFDILAWNRNSTNMPARLHNDFLGLFEANSLCEATAHTALETPLDLGAIDCDNFVVGAINDHLTPWKACFKATGLFGGASTFALSNGGHIAALVNPPGNPKAWHVMGPAEGGDPDAWLEGTEKLPGSWWEGWVAWVAKRSGKRVKAPTELGSADHPPLDDAPGRYVRE